MVGIAWAILPPLATLGAATLVFHEIAGVSAGRGSSYPVVTMAALVPWTFFASTLTSGVPSIVQNSTILTRIPFPRAALPTGSVGISLIDLTIAGAIFVIMSIVLGDGLPITALWFPVLFAIEVVLVLGVVMLASAVNVFARDVKLAVPLTVQLWMFLTPVLYPLEQVDKGLRALYLANPMTGLVESFKTVLLSPGGAPEFNLLVPAIVGAVALFALGYWYFSAVEHRFADVV
jgi:lipopolysaccharide transport system permease protein